ncbi:hypothetical protein J2S43_004652 [Catenuloplanes nepalensis]|uniref:Uncharacterized protein n=1 Tax=Catenuloplanes nepalensis TaxID=587533 RepID=A0ABT9MXM8_9ACTN|nr:hypothetical protein [Catenuloplanes nepalensis]MDP9796140.1 hypothetical protein [Catenuloplanes nepalensis]
MADDKIVIPGPYSQPPIDLSDDEEEEDTPPPQLPEVGSLDAPAPNVDPPTLTVSETWTDDTEGRWQSGPDITVEKPPSGDKDQEPLVDNTPHVQQFSINTGNVVDSVKLAITDLKTAVTAYNTHKAYVKDNLWFFSVATKEDIGADNDPFSNMTDNESFDFSTGMYWNSGTQSNNYTGPSREMVEQLETYQNRLIASAADVITLVSQFTLAVDGAAQAYAQIDYSSQFPDPPVITEVTMDNNTGNIS